MDDKALKEIADMDDGQEKPRNVYISKDGFETIPLRRGFTEIQPLWDLLQRHREQFNSDIFICGGYARYCASPRPNPIKAKDVDIYSATAEAFQHLVEELDSKLEVKHENDVSKTYQRAEEGPFRFTPVIQIIKPIKKGSIVAFGPREEILENFDFTVIRCCIQTPTEVLVDADFIHDEEKLILRIKNIHCPISSTLRFMKYAKKGYWAPPMHVMPLFYDWDKRDNEYKDKLANYLISANEGTGLTKEEVEELEALMMID